jgi:hypothetical protein
MGMRRVRLEPLTAIDQLLRLANTVVHGWVEQRGAHLRGIALDRKLDVLRVRYPDLAP